MKKLVILLILLTSFIFSNNTRIEKRIKYVSRYYHSETIDTKGEFKELYLGLKKAYKITGIRPSLLLAIFEQESDFRYKLKHRYMRKHKTSAQGLGGVVYKFNKKLLSSYGITHKSLYTIRGNVIASALILKQKIRQFGSETRGIMAYFGNMKSHKYVNSVKRKEKKYRGYSLKR